MTSLIEIITSASDDVRDTPLEQAVMGLSQKQLLNSCEELDALWRSSDNLYHRVRALTFLAAIYRFYLPTRLPVDNTGLVPFGAFEHILDRRFRESIDQLLSSLKSTGPNDAVCSALASAYHQLAFQTLADQVRKSVRTVKGNQWMFRIGHPADHPLRIRPELVKTNSAAFPILREQTSVRMDFSHSGWSDIFFLGMDYPEGARVMNASINLGVHGRDPEPSPPIEVYLRVIDEPVLRLVSVDLNAHADVKTIAEVFDFARDYLGLLKAAVIASGIVPPGMEGCDMPMEAVFARMIGPGYGLEIVSKVNDIPKGSRLAVSTNLLGSLISVCMRATGQVENLAGGLLEEERRIVAARAILGEWLGGSGGGWQDSGGVWPGIKLIEGALATADDPEFGISKGCLLPRHTVLGDQEISAATRQKLQDSLVLVHGGMAQNVGPILEMVTERYLLRSPKEWGARQKVMNLLDEMVASLKGGDIPEVGKATHETFFEHLQTIIPWCTNQYTQLLVEHAESKFKEKFHGFWMLGGMAGGGMGFIFEPSVKEEAQSWLQEIMLATKHRLRYSLPFAMDPVVYDFEINDKGSWCDKLEFHTARMPDSYYALMAPGWLRSEARDLTPMIRHELETLGETVRTGESPAGTALLERMLPEKNSGEEKHQDLKLMLEQWGFDKEQHEQVRGDLLDGRIGLAQNRMPSTTTIEDVQDGDFVETRSGIDQRLVDLGEQSIRNGEVAVVTLAAGAGSRWTQGAGVVKALNPFCRFNGIHRSFLEVHLAKSRKVHQTFGTPIPHVFTTSYLTDAPIRDYLKTTNNHGYEGPLLVSTGKSVGLRMIPTTRDLRFAWEEMPQQVLDEQQEKMRSSVRAALMNWAQSQGEGSDYTDNLPLQCMHPVGHWYEIPNLLRSGTLQQLLQQRPQLKYLLLHNIDTLGATVDPGLLGIHIDGGSHITIEVIQRRLQDHGGGLARVNGRVQLLEGLASPHEEDEFKLRFYNSMTTWIDIDKLLSHFGLDRTLIQDAAAVDSAITAAAGAMKTYVTIKDVKKRWGRGQEDIFPVIQFERLWGDMTALPSIKAQFAVVPLTRGQQLKEPAELDGWMLDGSKDAVNEHAAWV